MGALSHMKSRFTALIILLLAAAPGLAASGPETSTAPLTVQVASVPGPVVPNATATDARMLPPGLEGAGLPDPSATGTRRWPPGHEGPGLAATSPGPMESASGPGFPASGSPKSLPAMSASPASGGLVAPGGDLYLSESLAASFPFIIPASPPQTIITAQTLRVASGIATLEGNVRAVREGDLLTAGKALLGNDPRWLLASQTPRLYRKETIADKQVSRETTLDATSIYWNTSTGELDASEAVVVNLEERSWDLATYTWAHISADHMVGDRDNKILTFHGNVRIKDKTRAGQGEHLDYFKASSTAILRGNAHLEGEEWSEKEKTMKKRTIDGQRIEYRIDTKAMQSE